MAQATRRRPPTTREQARRRIWSGRRLFWVLAAVALVAVVVLATRNARSPADSPASPPTPAANGRARPEVGAPVPDFRLTEADGRALTPGALRDRPAIVWFTTSYCVPCQVGAGPVAALDDALGGRAFDVLVVFVDPAEPVSALTGWRSSFARDDWMVALDTDGLAQRTGVQYLDTKWLLDRDGVIRDIDAQVADDAYIARIRSLVEQPR